MAGRNGISRADEIEAVNEGRRHRWLAGQIDEVEDRTFRHIDTLTESVRALTKELAANREVVTETRLEMKGNANKVLLAAFTAAVALIGGIILAVTF